MKCTECGQEKPEPECYKNRCEGCKCKNCPKFEDCDNKKCYLCKKRNHGYTTVQWPYYPTQTVSGQTHDVWYYPGFRSYSNS